MTDEEKKAQEIQEKAEREAKEKAAKELEEKELAEQKDADEKKRQDAAQPSTKSPLEEARTLDKSIKEGTAKIQKLFEKNEKIMADAAISGKGFAGQSPTAPKTDDEKWAEDAKKRYAGTGMDPTPDPDSGPTKYS
jgi:ribosomal protein L3